ncbi:emerin isoform X4 [Lissotriton helveticus]
MEKYKGMTDEELISALKKYSIAHGPVVGTTRKLYERKIYEFETQKTKHSPSKQTYTYSDSESPMYESKRYDVLSREGLSKGSPAYQPEGGDDYYSESYSTTKTYSEPPVRQRLREEDVVSPNIESKYYSKENAYQNVSQYSASSGSSMSVEPRRGIREKPKEAESTTARRFCPLWLQFVLLFLIIGFLAFVYFFVQPEDENPFKEIQN